MCGITGYLAGSARPKDELLGVAARMADALRHRGPDADGTFADPAAGLALGHRRLAILGLGVGGAQPMAGAEERRTVVYNGELYNFPELRARLDREVGVSWRGGSDTEVLLAAVAAWGMDETLRRAVGMFAFALWDREARTLTLARDRFGEKPLYYGWLGGAFLFGSELKSLRVHPAFAASGAAIDREALALYLRRQYIPAPRTIHENVFKLPAGTTVTVRVDESGRFDRADPVPYWSLRESVAAGRAEPFAGSEAEAADELERLLVRSVEGQMLSDVPLGALLSGGVDSSLVTALMQSRSSRPVRTFTVGFTDAAFDESRDAEAVARHLGTEHLTLTATGSDALEIVPLLPALYDEPFADVSQIPTHLVARLTREHVTVCLSGDGGDELFAGYNRHIHAPRLWERLRGLPRSLRSALGAALGFAVDAVPPGLLDAAYGLFGGGERLASTKAAKLAAMLGAASREDLYRRLTSTWPDPARLLVSGGEPEGATDVCPDGLAFTAWMQCMDAATYLPDDVLAKVDRAAMGAGLETRAPFLDHRVAAFAWRLPERLRVAGGRGKVLPRMVLERHVPRQLFERPKMGFGAPVAEWLRGPLRGWAEDLLAGDRLRREGYFRPEPIRALWRAHISGRRDGAYRLWTVLMFQAWLEAQGTEARA